MNPTPQLKLRILFVDDEPHLREFMKTELPRLGHDVTVCHDTRSAVETLARATFDAAILDLKMEHDTSGLQVLTHLKQVSPDTEAVIMTGYASQETTVTALRLGAFDYLTKPCKLADIEGLLFRITEKKKLSNHAAALQTRVVAAEGPGRMIGTSRAMLPVVQFVETVAPTDATVLITGETGTGKEVVARSIFMKSHRAGMPFVPVNCGAVAQNLAESELFGHRKGSFTGADKDRKGMFEVANGGTLFLDELGELDKNIQVKMLRFLESGEVRRLGDTESITSDVRVVCATNRDLRKEIAEGRFREDLLFRLNTFHIHLPPLRERVEDIPDLALHLLARHAKRPAESLVGLLTSDALQLMMGYYWPGNVRELSNAMEYAWIVSGGRPITATHLPHDVRNGRPAPMAAPTPPPATLPFPTQTYAPPPAMIAPAPAAPAQPRGKTLEDVEMEYILQVYAKNNQNKQATATELGISLKTLYNKLHKYEDERQRNAG
ncbi:sigma-54-dependent transcriptional regulator [Limnoglobus roseus]|uniref:Sigma-54-dependent Fis family transcriptional regulator n=1 Tax=Limnoglobus roseus TaxID=2598579 RepID=A0A5C1AD63_9BACT|nr:sigma-54 dependent transcriptional regulator [Limnoglobus roseus]QEL16585.1 sigma-54-dependent Fis family transcriptional regulator [Limnoglobus roseus]